jgi:hypothetical protein
MPDYPKPPYPRQHQPMPGSTAKMDPRPDHGETSYKGSGRLQGKRAIITGGDSGIGRAVAIAFAREGADTLIAYLNESEDAKEVADLIAKEGRKAVLVEGDLRSADHSGKSSNVPCATWAGSIFWSTTPRTRLPSRIWATSATRNGG